MAQPIPIRVISIAVNLPGPMAAMRLAQLGATVTKIEPPQGDPLAHAYPEWYRELHRGQRVLVLDLKTEDGRARLEELLADADLLLTAIRPQALNALGLDWEGLHRRYPRLCHAAIVGFPPPNHNRPGHDLLFQAQVGLLDPPRLPRALIADSAGAERAVSTALALLLARVSAGEGSFGMVSLAEAVAPFAAPIRYRATDRDGILGGALPGYSLYPTRSGWLAVAAIESSFRAALLRALDISDIDHKTLARIFLTRTAQEWEAWGKQHDIPIAAVVNLEH